VSGSAGQTGFVPPADDLLATGRAAVRAAAAALDLDGGPGSELLREAARAGLRALAAKAPGRSVEVRVPPWAAVQCVPGPRHTRGTPSAVVETDPVTWVGLASGRVDFADAVADGRVRAGGQRSDLSALLPL
jgi:Bacterial SCP ortholog